jgi:peptidoglycan-N-acetylglucosamine deacetylase
MREIIKRSIKSFLPDRVLLQRLSDKFHHSILLTFDDGPHPDITGKVIDFLKPFGARALFFISGKRIERTPHILHRITDAGHEIGNHSYVHSNNKQPNFWAYMRDIERCQKELIRFGILPPRFFRPPRGILSPTTLIAPLICGLHTMTWSVDVQDWCCKSIQDAEEASQKLLHELKPGDIVLLHDDHPYVLDILKIILPELVVRGIDFSDALDSFG